MREQEVRNLWEAYLEVCENQQLDELSSEVISRTSHRRMQNLSAAQKEEDGARDAGATMGERSKRAEETSDAAAKVSKNRKLSSAHARSRSRMNKEEVENWVNDLIEEGYDLSEYTWDDMYEAYANLNEGRTTSLSALSSESQKRKDDKKRGRPETESETHSRLAMGKFRPGASQKERAEGGRQVLKDRGKVPKKGGKDMFEHILEYLVAEGYADTNENALAIMVNMSEEWRQDIMEISQTTKIKAYAASRDVDADYAYGSKVHDQGDRIKKEIVKKHGEEAGEHAERAADAQNFGRGTPRAKPRIEKNRTYRTTKAGSMHGQDQAKLKSDLIKRRNK